MSRVFLGELLIYLRGFCTTVLPSVLALLWWSKHLYHLHYFISTRVQGFCRRCCKVQGIRSYNMILNLFKMCSCQTHTSQRLILCQDLPWKRDKCIITFELHLEKQESWSPSKDPICPIWRHVHFSTVQNHIPLRNHTNCSHQSLNMVYKKIMYSNYSHSP